MLYGHLRMRPEWTAIRDMAKRDRQSRGCSCTLTPVKQGNHPKVEKPQSQSVTTRIESAAMRSRRQRTNPHKELAECRRKKQSKSCFFGRRAGTTQRKNKKALHRKRNSRQSRRSTMPWSNKTRNDKDPFERKLPGGCVVTRWLRKRLAAECRGETTHLKLESERSQDAWVMLIVVNEAEK